MNLNSFLEMTLKIESTSSDWMLGFLDRKSKTETSLEKKTKNSLIKAEATIKHTEESIKTQQSTVEGDYD